ncbi:MAG TPA: DUF1631 family protein, partial [Albitalea sp.]|nr:DUF1631 family protein [Albitalea sp.]
MPVVLEAAVGHVKATMSSVAERVAAGLGNQSHSSTRAGERDLLLSTQIELRRKMNAFHMAFTKVLHDKVMAEANPRHVLSGRPQATDWQSLSLVDDHELEQKMFSGRIGQQITHTCEWELREVAAYMGAVLGLGRADEEHNPLRADVIGAAVYSGVEAAISDAEGRKLLARELGFAMAKAMPECYQGIVRELQSRNVQPVGLTVKTVDGPGNTLPGVNTGYASVRDEMHSTRSALGTDFHGSMGGAPTQPAALGDVARAVSAADAHLMTLLRRLTYLASRPGSLDPPMTSYSAARTSGHGAPMGFAGGAGSNSAMSGLMAVNLIRAHRDELVQASTGTLDHMVIDVVGSLFDQILSDSRVPPQMARQIARLQLPVLRVALADQTFFSSRKHPVRRFVNRIASLACAYDEFDDGPGKQLLDRVRDLVQEIVDGDFDQVDLYTSKLAALESFIANQNEDEVKTSGAASVLESKESELRVQQRYMLHLQSSLNALTMPDYLRDFVSQVWSQALVAATRKHGADSEVAKRFRQVGRDLVMSVQPKGSPTMR